MIPSAASVASPGPSPMTDAVPCPGCARPYGREGRPRFAADAMLPGAARPDSSGAPKTLCTNGFGAGAP